MADILHTGAIPKCSLCNILEFVNSYCKICKQYICDRCENEHEISSPNHHLVGAFEGLLADRQAKILCQKHNQYFQFYCIQCSTNSCDTCLKIDHESHEFQDIRQHAEGLREKFVEDLERSEDRLAEVKVQLKNVELFETKFNKETQAQIAAVRNAAESRQYKLDGRDIIEELNEEENEVKSIIKDELRKIQESQSEQQNLIQSLKSEIFRIPDPAILEFVNDAKERLQINSDDIQFKIRNASLFKPSASTDIDSKTLGTLCNTGYTVFSIGSKFKSYETGAPSDTDTTSQPKSQTVSNLLLKQELGVIKRFQPDIDTEAVLSLCTTHDNDCWIGVQTDDDTDYMLLVNQAGVIKQRVHMSHYTNFVSQTTSGRILVSGVGTTKITCMDQHGHKSAFADIAEPDVRCVAGIAVTQNDDVFVCIRMKPHREDKVIKLSAEGNNILQIDQSYFQSDRLYGVHAVACDKICVQDGMWEDTGSRLVVLDEAGNLIKYITRARELQTNIKAMTWDTQGNIITGTWEGEYVHVLDMSGSCKKSYVVSRSQQIWGLALDMDNVLWIGTSSGEVIIARYLE